MGCAGDEWQNSRTVNKHKGSTGMKQLPGCTQPHTAPSQSSTQQTHLHIQRHCPAQQACHGGAPQPVAIAGCCKELSQLPRLLLLPAAQSVTAAVSGWAGCRSAAGGRSGR